MKKLQKSNIRELPESITAPKLNPQRDPEHECFLFHLYEDEL